MKSIRSVRIVGVAVVATLVILSNGCGRDVPSPTAPTPTPSPAPAPTPTPTPMPTTFSFILLGGDAMGKSASELPLWGLRGENTELEVKQMVFGDESALSNPGFGPMIRLNGPSVIISQLGAEHDAQLEGYARDLQEAIGFPVSLGKVVPEGSAGFAVKFNSTIGAPAWIYRYVSNGVVTGGLIEVREIGCVFTVLHELGHGFGLDHHTGQGLMSVEDSVSLGFSMSEKDNINMMKRVPPGTEFPSGNASFRASLSSRKGMTGVYLIR